MSVETQKPSLAEAQEPVEPIVLGTDMPGLTLRQMVSEHDDEQYYDFQNRNVEHIAEFGNSIYDSVAIVTEKRLEHGNGRFGVWFEGALVGIVSYSTKGHEKEAEMGILLDQDATGHGYATASVRALTKYATHHFDRVYAEVAPDNEKSISLLERTGYQATGETVEREWGSALVFEAAK